MNQRQFNILHEFYENEDHFLTASYFSKEQNVSLRTIQTDIKTIKEELAETKFAVLESITPKGSRLVVIDEEKFTNYLSKNYSNNITQQIDSPINRINQLICRLIEQFFAVYKTSLEDEFFVSRSTLTNDLKRASEILQIYNLRIVTKNNRISISGTEINKRNCLAKNDYYLSIYHSGDSSIDEQRKNYFRRVLTEYFEQENYYIDSEGFENAILTLYIIINRMEKGFFIRAKDLDFISHDTKEYSISSKVFERIQNHYLVSIPDEEIEYFSMYLTSVGAYDDVNMISTNLRKDITTILKKVNEKYSMDFSENEDLINHLALHCIPLSVRVKYDMQIENHSGASIREDYPLGYNMATYFSHKYARKFNKAIKEDEIAYFAIYFQNALNKYNIVKNKKKILVISSMKYSMYMLMKQNIMEKFHDKIDVLDFKFMSKIKDEDYAKYDVIFATQKEDCINDNIHYINKVLNSSDYMTILLALDGFNSMEDILNIFKEDLFYYSESLPKIDVLNKMVNLCESTYQITGLNKAVQRREQVGSTYFGNGVAIAQPMQSVCDETFISVCYSDMPIVWDKEGHTVNLILLVHIADNSNMLSSIWEFLAYIIKDKQTIEKLAVSPTYYTFISYIRNVIIANQ